MDSVTHALLYDIIRREGRSLLHYISESFPWTTPAEQDALARILAMVEEEEQGAAALLGVLRKKRLNPPYLGPYPMNFTNLNYISLTHLLPILIEYQKQRISDLETYLSRIPDVDAATIVRSILEYKGRHLQTLLDMSRSPGVAA